MRPRFVTGRNWTLDVTRRELSFHQYADDGPFSLRAAVDDALRHEPDGGPHPAIRDATEIDVIVEGQATLEADEAKGLFENLTQALTIDMSAVLAQDITDMSDMFRNCTNLREVNMNGITAESVTTMAHMFDGCPNLRWLRANSLEIPDTTDVTDMFDKSLTARSKRPEPAMTRDGKDG